MKIDIIKKKDLIFYLIFIFGVQNIFVFFLCNVVEVIVFVELLEKKSFIVDLLNVNLVVLFIDNGSFIMVLL